jgi:hypothetical protein
LDAIDKASLPEKLDLVSLLHFEFALVYFQQSAIGSREECGI